MKTVVHVVYKTDDQNISQSQIESQIKALNKDFRATNPDKSQTPEPWKGLVTDARVQFRLAKVTRTKTSKNGFSFDDGVKKASTGGIPPSGSDDTPQHVGVRANRRAAGLRAVSRRSSRDRRRRDQLPGVRHDRDGAGSPSTRAAPPRTRSAITSICGTSGATRPTAAAPTWPATRQTAPDPTPARRSWPVVTCNNGPNGDMFMNYMDYTDDAAMFMFTSQQVFRMRTALETVRGGLI